MTDLEMTKLCAEAMGLPTWMLNGLLCLKDSICSEYDPLNDDTQAMALVKRFGLLTGRTMLDSWLCAGRGATFIAETDDLNRAIVECVAKMQSKAGELVSPPENVEEK